MRFQLHQIFIRPEWKPVVANVNSFRMNESIFARIKRRPATYTRKKNVNKVFSTGQKRRAKFPAYIDLKRVYIFGWTLCFFSFLSGFFFVIHFFHECNILVFVDLLVWRKNWTNLTPAGQSVIFIGWKPLLTFFPNLFPPNHRKI